VHVLADQIPGYLNRLMVLPGITGLAQINLPPDMDLESVRRKLVVDMDYIHTATLWLDVRILLCTALRMAWVKGPAVTKALGLERAVFLPDAASVTGQLLPVSVAELAEKARVKSSRRPTASQA
jgi:hypothetical protein